MLRIEEQKIIYHYDAEELWIEGWGKNGLRIRATKNAQMPEEELYQTRISIGRKIQKTVRRILHINIKLVFCP